MGDSDPSEKKCELPSWQKKLKETTPTEGDEPAETPSRETIIEQARKFLEEDEVRNASTDKKIAFLEGKGLESEEIQELLGVTRNPEASASSTPSSQPSQQSSQASPPPPQPQYTPPQPQTRSAPPVITYPEFLTTPQAPTPLVTKARLLTTLYLFSGLSFLLYGTHNHLMIPMLDQLTTSRLSLAETATQNLKTLIQKLESLVSVLPPSELATKDSKTHGQEGSESDEDEDPTELFHRDIGIQTSLPPSPTLLPTTPPTPSPLSEQTTRLSTLKADLMALDEAYTSEAQELADLNSTIGVVKTDLDRMAYVAPVYGYGAGSVGPFGAMGGREDDEIGRVKAGIRGVKGVLLSARSFPAAVRGR